MTIRLMTIRLSAVSAAAVLAFLSPATPAVAQATGGAATPPSGVIAPPRGVDPNMKVKAPKLPPRSTPVIHPQPTAPDGTGIVVPKG